MRVVVTGASGNLGRVVVPALLERGDEVLALDLRPGPEGARWVEADVRDRAAVAAALAGADAVVHGAALHGVHLSRFPAAEFWSINATGTFTVYDAAREAGVRRVVLASTMGVYGASLRRTEDAFAWTDETLPLLPGDVYGLSKVVAEELARFHARAHAITSVALRFGMYVPETFVRYGFRLLFGGVDDRDVAHSVLLALEHEPEGGFAAFDIMADTPFRRDDAALMASDPGALVERCWPGSARLFEERGIEVEPLVWGETLWPVDHAKRVLGYRPRYDFGAFLEALRRDDEDHYPFRGLPQWGVGG